MSPWYVPGPATCRAGGASFGPGRRPVPAVVAGGPGAVAAGRLARLPAGVVLVEVPLAARRVAGARPVAAGAREERDHGRCEGRSGVGPGPGGPVVDDRVVSSGRSGTGTVGVRDAASFSSRTASARHRPGGVGGNAGMGVPGRTARAKSARTSARSSRTAVSCAASAVTPHPAPSSCTRRAGPCGAARSASLRISGWVRTQAVRSSRGAGPPGWSARR